MGCLHREKHQGFPATFPSNQLKRKTETTMVPEFKRFYVILPVLADIPTHSLRAYFFSCQKRTGFAGDTHFSQVIETLFTYFFLVLKSIPIGSMYGIFIYIWFIYGGNVGKYSIHGSYGIYLLFIRVTTGPFSAGDPKSSHQALGSEPGNSSQLRRWHLIG